MSDQSVCWCSLPPYYVAGDLSSEMHQYLMRKQKKEVVEFWLSPDDGMFAVSMCLRLDSAEDVMQP